MSPGSAARPRSAAAVIGSRFNDELLKDPSGINIDNYGAGWLFEMEGPKTDTMDVDEYYRFLDANWEKTQNMLKGHM